MELLDNLHLSDVPMVFAIDEYSEVQDIVTLPVTRLPPEEKDKAEDRPAA